MFPAETSLYCRTPETSVLQVHHQNKQLQGIKVVVRRQERQKWPPAKFSMYFPKSKNGPSLFQWSDLLIADNIPKHAVFKFNEFGSLVTRKVNLHFSVCSISFGQLLVSFFCFSIRYYFFKNIFYSCFLKCHSVFLVSVSCPLMVSKFALFFTIYFAVFWYYVLCYANVIWM